MTPEADPTLTQEQITSLVSRYLAGQGWELAAPERIAALIWEQLEGEAEKSAVLVQIPRRYAAVLHSRCQESGSAVYERAWQEVKSFLERTVGRLESHPATQQEVIQEALISLQQALPIKNPQAFLVFAFQTLRSRHIDWNRRQTAEKRDWRNTIPLEELGKSDETGESERGWEEYLRTSRTNWRTIEGTVSDQEVRRQLLEFAQTHLPTGLQQMVFEAHFLDGLRPADIAPLLGKRPHEIRLVKARIVKKLQSLPQDEAEQLLAIIGGSNRDT